MRFLVFGNNWRINLVEILLTSVTIAQTQNFANFVNETLSSCIVIYSSSRIYVAKKQSLKNPLDNFDILNTVSGVHFLNTFCVKVLQSIPSSIMLRHWVRSQTRPLPAAPLYDLDNISFRVDI